MNASLLHGLQQLGLGDRAVVVEVERVGVTLGHVGPGPAGRRGQVRAQLPGRAPVALSARAISAAPQAMSLFHSVPG